MNKLTREDRQHNKRIEQAYNERMFGTRTKVLIGACIFIGLLISLALFIGTVRATEEIVRHLNP